jgi:hypothetical protein
MGVRCDDCGILVVDELKKFMVDPEHFVYECGM